MTTQKEERAYVEGSKAAFRSMLQTCLIELGRGMELKAARLLHERAEAVAAFRRLMRELNIEDDFPDDLHLADMVSRLEKELL